MEHDIKGLALVRRQAAGSKILLVRTAPHATWTLPHAQSEESLEDLLAKLQTELIPGADFSRHAESSRPFALREGEVSFHLVGANVDVTPYFESDRFIDARWASFEEARHIVRSDLVEALQWSKRLLHKLPL